MAKVPPTKRSNNLSTKERKKLTITEIRYVAAPDAEARLSRAIDILLKAATQSNVPPVENGNTPSKPFRRQNEAGETA